MEKRTIRKQRGKTVLLPARKLDNKPLVRIRSLKTFFPIRKGVFLRVANHIRAVDHINLDIPKGATLALVGESGCGKNHSGRIYPAIGSRCTRRSIF